MPWFCDNCGRQMMGRFCKCGVNSAATRVPPLDGLLFFDDTPDNQGIPRYELMRVREGVNQPTPIATKGQRRRY